MNNYFDNDEDLDQWLRQQEAATSGPELPSEAVWERIRAARQDRRRRRRFFFWLFLGSLAGGIMWFLLTPPSSTQPPKSTQLPVADAHPHRQDQYGIRTPTHPIIDEPVHKPFTAIIHPGTNSRPPGLLPAAGPTTHSFSLQFHVPTESETHPGSAGALPAAGPTTHPFSLQFHVPTEAETRPESAGSLPAPLMARSYDKLERLPAQLNPLSWDRSMPNPTFLSMPVINPAPDNSCPGLEVGLVAGPMHSARRNAVGSNSTGAWTLQGGLHAGFRIGRRLSLESGLQWSDMRLFSTHTGVFTYAIQSEQYNADRQWFENSASEHLETGLGAVDLRYDIGWNGSRPLFDRERFRVRFDMEERLQYLRIPAGLRYQLGRGRWQWSLHGGMGLNLKLGYEVEIRDLNTDRLGIRRLQARAAGRADALNPAFVDLYAGLGVRYQLPRNLSLQLGPTVRYGMSPLAGTTNSLSTGGQLALIYSLRSCDNISKHSLNHK